MDDLTGIPEDPQEAALALLHSRAEVARLKEREQLFSALLASVNSVLWAYDWQNRRMVYVSPAYEKIFGRSAALLLADYEEWRNSIYPDDLDYADSSLLQVLERGAVEQREYRIVRTPGGGLAHQFLGAGDVRRTIPGAGHLGGGDGDVAGHGAPRVLARMAAGLGGGRLWVGRAGTGCRARSSDGRIYIR